MGKRVIEETASNEIFNDDWFLKDSPTQGTTKLSGSDLKSIMNIGQAESADLADAYDPNHNYVEGDVCIHDDTLHKANDDTTGTWDSTKWDAVTVAELIEEGGKVKDVKVNGTSVVDENKNANVTVPVLDVTVNGGSLVDNNKNAVLDSLVAYGESSGEIATFSDGSDLAMKSLKVAITPQQDLHGYDAPWVGGAGKNKLENIFSGTAWAVVGNDGSITLNGTTTSVNWLAINENVTLKAGTYTLSGTPLNAPSGLYVYDDGAFGNWSDQSGTGASKTFSEDTTGKILLRVPAGTYNNLKIYPMIESGSSKTTFAPYSNICPISGWTACNVTRTGKNLYKAELNNYYLDVSTGQPVTQAGYEVSEYIPIQSGQSIYIPASGTSRRWFYDKYKNPKTYLNNSDAQTYTAQEDGYIRLTLNKTISAYSTFQVEYGNQATTYEPYNGTTYTIQLGNTYYGGTLDVVSGVLTVDWVLKTLVGTETWTYTSTYNRVYTYISDAKKPSGAIIYSILSDKLHFSGGVKEDYGAHINNAGNLIVFAPSSITSADQWKTWLASNNIQVCYELATPQNIQLTPTQVKSLLGSNNVWADTGDILDAEYVRNLSTIINYILEQLNS